MCDSTNEYWHNNSGQCCCSVCDGHQSACIVWCDIDVIRQKATEHATDGSDA